MPPVRLGRDASWNCLYPYASNICRYQLSLPQTLSRPYARPRRELLSSARPTRKPTRPLRQCSCPRGPSLNLTHSSPALTSALRPQRQECLHNDTRSGSPFSEAKHCKPVEYIITQTYARLNREALEGRYEAVQKTVEKLVKRYDERPNSRLYEALIVANIDCWNGSANEVARLLQVMAEDGVEPNSAILHGALQVLAIHPDYLLRSHIMYELRQRWLSLTPSGWHNVVLGLLRDRQLEKSLDAIEQMQKAGATIQPWLYDIMIYTLCAAEEFDEVLRLLERRLDSDELSISPTLWAHTLDSASRALHYPLTLFAFNARVKTSYLNPSSGVCANILSTAARHGDTHLATSVLHVLSRRSGNSVQLHHYEALLETYIASKDLLSAFSLLAIMKRAAQPPTEASVRPIFTYLCQSRHDSYEAHGLLRLIRDEGRSVPVQAINVLIESYIYHQDLPAALELYKSMETLSPDLSPNIATFNNLLRGCALYKRKDIAMFLASEMVALGVAPNALTYDRLLLVCLNTDDMLDDTWRYFNEMKAAGWAPRGGTAITLARKACALGDRRVWDMVEDRNGRGIPRNRVESLVKELWRSCEEVVETERPADLEGTPSVKQSIPVTD